MTGWVADVLKAESVQVSKSLRRANMGYVHYCPPCDEMHMLPDAWAFNGDVERPTFSPSFKHTMPVAEGVPQICHYTITGGVVQYHSDCTHSMKDQTVPLSELPAHLCDEDQDQT